MHEEAEAMPAADGLSGRARGGRRRHVSRLGVREEEEFDHGNCRAERGRSRWPVAQRGVEIS